MFLDAAEGIDARQAELEADVGALLLDIVESLATGSSQAGGVPWSTICGNADTQILLGCLVDIDKRLAQIDYAVYATLGKLADTFHPHTASCTRDLMAALVTCSASVPVTPR
jgi:hypothetical protein